MNIEVAILAGGMGTRLKSRTGNIPKPMALLLGKPVLEYQIEQCKLNGFKKIALLVHYENQILKDYFNYGEKWGVNITYIEEKEPSNEQYNMINNINKKNIQIIKSKDFTILSIITC